MSQELDHKLDCPNCRTICLNFPKEISGETPTMLVLWSPHGRWAELESDFADARRLNGAFRLDEGKIIRVDQDPVQAPESSPDIEDLTKALPEHDRGK